MGVTRFARYVRQEDVASHNQALRSNTLHQVSTPLDDPMSAQSYFGLSDDESNCQGSIRQPVD